MPTCSELWQFLFEEVSLASKLFAIVEGTLSQDEPYLKVIDPSSNLEEKYKEVEILWRNTPVVLRVAKASAAGDNYMSVVYNLQVVIPGKETHQAFAKVVPVNTFLRDVATKSGVHQRENYMYHEVFPPLRELLAERSLQASEYLQVPELYFCQLNNPAKDNKSDTVLVLEDLRPQGYRMADKLRGCDMEHVTLALRSLARYHAVSIAYTRRQLASSTKEAFLDPLKEGIEADQEFLPIILKNVATFMRRLEQDQAAEKIERIIPNALNIISNEDIANCGPLSCIIHGDFWINNMLFSYDLDGHPQQVALVDWQISRLGHPAWDIVYFLLVSTTSQLRRQSLDLILDNYFTTLSETLEQLGIHLSKENYFGTDFRADFEQRLLKGTITGCMVLPFILNQSFAETVTSADGDNNGETPSVTEIDEKAFLQARDATLGAAYSPEKLYEVPLIRQRVSELILEMVDRCVL